MLPESQVFSAEYARLREQTRKGRISQSLTQLQIKQLTKKITQIQSEDIIRSILKEKPFSKRSIIDVYILMACIKNYDFFNKVLEGKGEKALQQFCKHLYYAQLHKDKYLYQIGDTADKFYILMSGTVSVQVAYKQEVINQKGQAVIQQRFKQAMRYQKGEVFGETISKQSASRRAASIYTQSDCQFFQVKKRDYQIVDKYMSVSLMREKYMFFQKIDLFSRLNKTNLETILYLTTPKEVTIGHVLFSQGHLLNEIYIVKQGQFKLECLVYGKEADLDPLSKLKAKVATKSRKFQTSIVGPKSVIGEIDILMDVPTKESCTCITERAYIYILQKKDLLVNIEEAPPIEGYINTRYSLRNQRFKNLNKTFNQNSSLISCFGYKRQQSGENNYSVSIQRQDKPRNRLKSEENSFIIKRKGSKKTNNAYFHQRSKTEQRQPSLGSLSQLSKISEMIKQKKKYSILRNNNDEPLFKFSKQIPIFLKVKMGVESSTLSIPQGENQSSKTLTGFLTSKKLSQTIKHPRKIIKREPRISANSKTVYGKFFQLLLDV